MSSIHAGTTRVRASETSAGACWMVATMLLGAAVAVVSFFALMLWADARQSHDSAVAHSRPSRRRR